MTVNYFGLKKIRGEFRNTTRTHEHSDWGVITQWPLVLLVVIFPTTQVIHYPLLKYFPDPHEEQVVLVEPKQVWQEMWQFTQLPAESN